MSVLGESISPALSAAGVGSMLSLAIMMALALFRYYGKQINQLNREARESRKRETLCTRRLNIVVVELNKNGIRMPDDFWDVPEDEKEKDDA